MEVSPASSLGSFSRDCYTPLVVPIHPQGPYEPVPLKEKHVTQKLFKGLYHNGHKAGSLFGWDPPLRKCVSRYLCFTRTFGTTATWSTAPSKLYRAMAWFSCWENSVVLRGSISRVLVHCHQIVIQNVSVKYNPNITLKPPLHNPCNPCSFHFLFHYP